MLSFHLYFIEYNKSVKVLTSNIYKRQKPNKKSTINNQNITLSSNWHCAVINNVTVHLSLEYYVDYDNKKIQK